MSAIKCERGNDQLIFKHFIYSKNTVLNNGEISWRYGQKRLKCKANVYTFVTDIFWVLKNDGVQNQKTND